MSRTTIRRAGLKDLDAICSLSQYLFDHERQFTDEYHMAWSKEPAGRNFFTKCLCSRKSFTFLAVSDGKVVGYILIKLLTFAWRGFNPVAEVTNVSVDPMYRGQGIGTKLFTHAIELAKKRGAKRMSVEALADNLAAIRLYKRLGFADFSETRLMRLN